MYTVKGMRELPVFTLSFIPLVPVYTATRQEQGVLLLDLVCTHGISMNAKS